MGVCNCSMFCCMLLYVHSSIAIILMGKRELVALLNLSSWCLMMVEWRLPCSATGLSAVCDCGISWSYSLFSNLRPLVYKAKCSIGMPWSVWSGLMLFFVRPIGPNLLRWLRFYTCPLYTSDFLLFSSIWATTWDFQQCGMCDQQSLRSACAYAQSDQSLC